MNKRCTNSACRKKFSTVMYGKSCPFCHKRYPQLIQDGSVGIMLTERAGVNAYKFIRYELVERGLMVYPGFDSIVRFMKCLEPLRGVRRGHERKVMKALTEAGFKVRIVR